MIAWIKSLFAAFLTQVEPTTRATPPERRPDHATPIPAEGHKRWAGAAERRQGERRKAGRRQSDQVEAASPALPREAELPAPMRGAGLDASETISQSLRVRQREIIERIGDRVARGKFELPHLPSTSLVVMDLAANPGSEIADIVQSLSTDPVLSTRLLRLANSALYATQEPVETLGEAVMRVGMRELRSLIFALSMRQVIFRTEHLTSYAEETWRQSYSVGVVARAIARPLGFDGDKAFLVGLLHDVGKISLLAMLQREVKTPTDATPALVGRVFLNFHEAAGEEMARKWKLSEEFVSIAGNHHDYETNEEYPRTAALVSLAHRLDLALSTADPRYWQTSLYPQLDFLGVAEDKRHEVLHSAHDVFLRNTDEAAAAA